MLDIRTAITAPVNTLNIKIKINDKIAVKIEYTTVSLFIDGLDTLLVDKNINENNVIPFKSSTILSTNFWVTIIYTKKQNK